MFLLDKAHKAIYLIVRLACGCKFVPYNWNRSKHRLETPSRLALVIFYFMCAHPPLTLCFQVVRLIQTKSWPNVPPRFRIMNINWCLAWSLFTICKVQFLVRRHEIRIFSNHIFERMETSLTEAKNEEYKRLRIREGTGAGDRKSSRSSVSPFKTVSAPDRAPERSTDWFSVIILLALYMLIVNPPPHAFILFDIPCAAQYFTSLVFECNHMADNLTRWYQVFPFVVWETYVILDLLVIWSFCWVLSYVPLNLMRDDLAAKTRAIPSWVTAGIEDERVVSEYRKAQLTRLLLNDAFNVYLLWFPSLLFVTSGFLLFGTIRFYHLQFYLYAVFPACAVRCLFEAVTLLEVAGETSAASARFLQATRAHLKTNLEEAGLAGYMRAFLRSSRKLMVSAGSLYTFEHTIVLVSLHNMLQFVFNLLIGYPKPSDNALSER